MSEHSVLFRFRDDGATPGAVWKSLFSYFWPSYQMWFLREGIGARATYGASRRAISSHMPELVGLYDDLCAASGGEDIAARFLSGYCPPAYVTGCSQVIAETEAGPTLLRNYDYAPRLLEGTVLHTHWQGRHVTGVCDGLWGLLDGMNDLGLAASLSFGGRKIVGQGFGITHIIRYLLQTCGSVAEAFEALKLVPSHMAYNIALLDRSGDFMICELGPEGAVGRKEKRMCTNHQVLEGWSKYQAQVKSVEREQYLAEALQEPKTRAQWQELFQRAPLIAENYRGSHGTLYTGAYTPTADKITLSWPQGQLDMSAETVPCLDVPVYYADRPAV